MSLTDEDKLWITEQLGLLTPTLDGLTQRTDGLAQRMDRLTEQVQGLTRYVLDFRTETIQRFDAIDRRLEFLGGAFTSIDSRLPALNKALVDFSALAGQLTSEQWRAKDATTDLAGRTTRLEDRISKLVNPAA